MRMADRKSTSTGIPSSPKKSPADDTPEQRERMQRGLRILARMIGTRPPAAGVTHALVGAAIGRRAWELIPSENQPASSISHVFPWAPAIVLRLAPYHKTRSNVMSCRALCSTNFSWTMECQTIAQGGKALTTKQPATPESTEHTARENQPALTGAIGNYVRAHQRLHGQMKTAETLGVSRHTLWRFLERGHTGRAVPAAVLKSVGGSVQDIEAATLEIIIDLEGLRPDPALGPLRDGLEDALLCAAPLSTVDELARFGRVPASTFRERLDKLAKRGLVDSVSHYLGALGSRPQRRYLPTEQGVTAAGAATEGRKHMLRTYPLSKQWFRLLAEHLDAVAVLYGVAAMVADADPHQDPVRVDHYRKGPYDMLLTLSRGRSVGIIRQGPALPGSNLRYRLRSIEHLPSSETPFFTLALTHADQATRRAIRSLGSPTEHRRTFVATEGELLAGDHTGAVWQQCGSGLGEDPPVPVSPDASLPDILAWAERLLESSHSFLRDNPRPDPDTLYPSGVQATMPEPAQQLASALATQLTRAEKEALDLLGAWPLCIREQLAGLMGGVTPRRVKQVLRSLRQHELAREDDSLFMLTDQGLTYLARRDRAAVGLTLDRWTAQPSYSTPRSTRAPPCAPWPPRCATTPA